MNCLTFSCSSFWFSGSSFLCQVLRNNLYCKIKNFYLATYESLINQIVIWHTFLLIYNGNILNEKLLTILREQKKGFQENQLFSKKSIRIMRKCVTTRNTICIFLFFISFKISSLLKLPLIIDLILIRILFHVLKLQLEYAII